MSHDPLQIYNQKQLARLLGKNPATIYRWTRSGKLPRPVRVNGRIVGWPAGVIADWMDAKAVAA